MIGFLTMLAISALVGGLPWIAVAILQHRQHAAKQRDRIDRMVRQDIAWQSWCDACSRAITEGKQIPKWREPS